MGESNVVTPLSDALSGGIARIYTLGGLGLTFVFVGALMLLTSALIPRGPISLVLAGIGLISILVVIVLFYQREIRPMRDVRRSITANAELVDVVQETALAMTALAKDLQALSFKHASEIATLVVRFKDWARERGQLVAALPGGTKLVERLIDNEYTHQAVDLSETIVRTTESAEKIISDIETALVHSDPSGLKRYVAQIRDLDERLKGVLARPRDASESTV